MFDKNYFKNYKDQSFKWNFWSYIIKKYTNKDSSILELGCTYGYLFKHLNGYKSLYGIDISKHAINVAKSFNHNATFEVQDVQNLKFKPNTFDLIVAIDILEHLPDPKKGIQEIFKVLKPNGYLIISTPNPDSYSHKIKKKQWFAYKDQTHISIHNKEYWINLLKENNFKIKKSTTIDLFDFPYLTKLARLLNLILYRIKSPFLKQIGDNSVIIAQLNQ
ncbi:class I SAM-dependent methyltransferase [Candidatus Pacearchaeota archaeon]|nr:class I SAM-dependent methyltransferase [Candidatus Pacearchaeota archaeon]